MNAEAVRFLWVSVMKGLVYILVWAALAGAPEVILTLTIDLIAKALARADQAARLVPR